MGLTYLSTLTLAVKSFLWRLFSVLNMQYEHVYISSEQDKFIAVDKTGVRRSASTA